MTLLPHWDEAILDIRKLEDYCLSHRTRVADTRLEYSDTRLGSSAATQPGCEMFCLKPRGPAKLLKSLETLGGLLGVSIYPSSDSERVLW